jgi:hypothetical protein
MTQGGPTDPRFQKHWLPIAGCPRWLGFLDRIFAGR